MTDVLREPSAHAGEGALFDLERPAPDLPAAESERFAPLRAGILNLWQYDDQELRFHQGRLLLRGENGTGKSKALELLLPFLLDADLSPHRLDPFAGTARTMYWNLLEGERHESRVGYVWLELGRREASGAPGGGSEAPVYWTIGCGLRATRRTRRVDSWYFVARRRVGGDLALVTPQNVPLLKDELVRTLGDDGTVYDTGKDYRERLDQLFFALGQDRFAALRHLLLQLRRPQLSQKLDPGSLSDLLAESLPPIDSDLVAELSEGFERLEEDERELVRVEAAGRQVESFIEVYRSYGRGVARARAAAVRQADSRYHKTAAEVREAEAERDRLEGELAALHAHREATEEALAASRGTLRALEQSETMRSGEALAAKLRHVEDLEAHARQDRAGLERAERALESRRREDETAAREARETARAREERQGRARTAAAEACLEAACAAAAESLDADPDAAAATARTAIGRRREAIAELSDLDAERRGARERWQRSEERRQDAEARLEAAAERARRAEREADREAGLLGEALAAWAAAATELAPGDDGLARLLATVAGGGAEPVAAAPGTGEEADGQEAAAAGELAAAVARLAVPVRDERVRELSDLDAEDREVTAERTETAAERARVEAGGELAPEPPRTRAADRTDRPGGPLYLLVDFREDLAAGDRPGLEAALEASGLLDAWVSPGGKLLDPGTFDTVLAPAPRQRPGTLADALTPVSGHGVSEEVIDALLRSVDWADAGGGVGIESAAGAHRVGSDGSWRLGPLRGAWAKSDPEHVGGAAREAARRRRLAELDEHLAALDRRLETLGEARRSLERRLERLAAEVAAAPSEEPLRQARHRAGAAGEEEGRRRQELAREEEATAHARQEEQAAARRLDRRARELDPGREWTDRLEDLDELVRWLRDFEVAFERLVDAVRSHGAARERSAAAAALLADAVAERDALATRSAEAARRSAAARAEHDALESTVGREVREVMARHRREKEHLEELEAQERTLAEEREAAIDQRAGARTRLELRQAELVERDAERDRAVAGLERLTALGFLQLALERAPDRASGEAAEVAEAPPPDEPPASLTAALQLAREIERATADVDLSEDAVDRRANRLYERYQQLLSDLGPDFQPSMRQEEDLAVVRVVHNGAERDVPALLALLRENAETRRALLADHERDLLRHFLLGEVGDHLRSRLRRARELVGDMNELLGDCPTASGMVLRLAWRPAADAGPDVREAVELLQRDPALLADAERRRLERFFLGRIEEARRRFEAVPWREHLMAALDYRRWHRFHVLRKTPQDDGWHELTRHGHAAASGGEKAVALHLPLFAAAAAHYRSAHPSAPRLVMLDEAFAGIDQGMRGRCMKLLVDFDLDFMMTSHDEWGCYEELPGLAIYQLYRDPAFEGVGAVRFVWSGGRLREDGDATAG